MLDFAQQNISVTRREPTIWVSRMVILSAIEPFTPIQDIPLKRGLNIIWAEEREPVGDTDRMSGHSAGKTSFCRLLRYCLGETGFAHPLNQKRIKALFSDGYVAAEVFLNGSQWAVARPLGNRHRTFAAQECRIEDLFKKEHATFDDFRENLSPAILGKLQGQAIPHSTQTIRWEHVLAWCTRDQETRYQATHFWRAPRSESGTPKFDRPKADAMFVMRAVLGLIFEDEVALEQRVREKENRIEALKSDMETKRKEPTYWQNHYRSRLLTLLDGNILHDIPLRSDDLFSPDLERLSASKLESLDGEISVLKGRLDAAEDELSRIDRVRGKHDAEIESIKSTLSVWDEKRASAGNQLGELEQLKQRLLAKKDTTCRDGMELYRNCNGFMEQLNSVNMSDEARKKALKKQSEESTEMIRLMNQQLTDLESAMQALDQERAGAKRERDGLRAAIFAKETARQEIQNTYSNLLKKTTAADPGNSEGDLTLIQQQIDELEKAIATERARLATVPQAMQDRLNRLRRVFGLIAQGVLSQGYGGHVHIKDGDLKFDLSDSGGLAGEAMETLSVLFADITSMLDTAFNGGAHPGFLLHDSPREADLAIGIYHKLFRFMAELQHWCEETGEAPYQYIVTTTSPPPSEMGDSGFIALELSAARAEDMLFKKDLLLADEIQNEIRIE